MPEVICQLDACSEDHGERGVAHGPVVAMLTVCKRLDVVELGEPQPASTTARAAPASTQDFAHRVDLVITTSRAITLLLKADSAGPRHDNTAREVKKYLATDV